MTTIKAKPDATNSELDAKVIIQQPSLTESQIYNLIQQYVEIKVDNMDLPYIIQFAKEQLADWYSDFSLDELKDTIDVNDEGLYDELVDNVTHTFTSEDN